MRRIRAGTLPGLLLLLLLGGAPAAMAQAPAQGDGGAAETELRAALAARPEDPGAMERLADLLEHNGRSHAALALRRRAVERAAAGPARREAQVRLASSLVDAAQYDEALPLLQSVLAEDASDEPARFEMGTLLARRDEFAGAFAAFAEAVRLRPDDAEAQLSAAKALVTLVRYSEAKPYLDAAAKLGGDPEQVHLLRGLVAAHTGQETQAETELRAALQLNPADTEARLALGETLRQEGKTDEAARELEAVAATRPGVSVEFQLVKLYRQMGDAERERRAAEELKRLEDERANDTRVEVLRQKADAAARAGQPAEAAKAYQAALLLRPGDAELLYRMALIVGAKGDRVQKRALLEQAVAQTQPPAGALVELGTMDGEGGDTAGAERAYRRALESDPQRPDALCNLAVLQGQAGNFATAERLLREAMESDPGYGLAYRDLGLIEAAQGRAAEAETTLRQGMARVPGEAVLPLTLGRILLAEHRAAEATEPLRTARRLAPDDLAAGVLLAQALEETGRRKEALEQIRDVLRAEPREAEALRMRATMCAGTDARQGEMAQLCGAAQAP